MQVPANHEHLNSNLLLHMYVCAQCVCACVFACVCDSK